MKNESILHVRSIKRRIIPAIVALLFVSAIAEAATLTVGTCPGAGFSTIQSAVNAAHAGDTVNVCPGSYPEQVSINKALTVQGITVSNQDAAVILPPIGGLLANATDPISGLPEAAQVLVAPEGNRMKSVTLYNLAIDGTNNGVTACTPGVTGILYQNASGTISNVAIRNQMLPTALSGCDSGTGIRVESSQNVSGTKSVTVQNSTVHDYQKNGITALGDGSSVKLLSNSVRGQGPTTGGTENGIQVSYGAVGQVENNNVIDNIFLGNNEFVASGILIYESSGVQVMGNTVGNNQFGVAVESTAMAAADMTIIKNNEIFGTLDVDGIDLCSNNNTVSNNTIASSDESGVDLDSGCGSTGNGNSVTSNTINEACAGILEESGTSGNTISKNNFFNVTNVTLSADVCPTPASGEAHAHGDFARPVLAPSD
jgi:parallel beta helix pectate lyase-like protein